MRIKKRRSWSPEFIPYSHAERGRKKLLWRQTVLTE